MIRVYFGPMGARKTGQLIDDYEKIEENVYYKGRILVFSPKRDNRFGIGKIKERDIVEKDGNKILGREIDSIAIEDIFEMKKHLDTQKRRYKNIFIDELNFFESEPNKEKRITLRNLEKRRFESMKIILELSLKNKIDFHLYGLNLTAEMHPYGLMATAITFADPNERHELFAQCADCMDIARYTYYIPYEKGTNVIGANDYCALCGPCHLEWSELYKSNKHRGTLDEYYSEAKMLKPELEEEVKDPVKKLTLPLWYTSY